MRFKILDNGRVKDMMQNVDFDPRKQKNRIAALRFKEQGDSELLDIIKRIDASEKAQTKNKPQTRMAGDEIPEGLDALINDIRETPDYELGIDSNPYTKENKRQTKDLAEQLARYARQDYALERAGVPHQAIGALLDDKMANGSPMPYVDTTSKPGVERRVHMGEAINKRTNELEVVPFMDGQEVLVSEFGDGRKGQIDGFTPSQSEKATEYVAERILKLMGKAPVRGPHKGVDFQIPEEGMKGIDAQIQRGPDVTQTQLYTYLRPSGKEYDVSPQGGRGVVSEVNSMIKNAPNANTSNIVDVVEGLANNREFNDYHGNRFGKALKDDYNEVLMPEYSVEFANKNQAAYDSITHPPEAIRLVDLSKSLEGITGMSAKEAIDSGEARVSWNLGNNRTGPTRARININTPREAVSDVVSQYPLTAQMLRTLK